MKIYVNISIITTTYSTSRNVASVYDFKVKKNFLPARQAPRSYGPAPVDFLYTIFCRLFCTISYTLQKYLFTSKSLLANKRLHQARLLQLKTRLHLFIKNYMLGYVLSKVRGVLNNSTLIPYVSAHFYIIYNLVHRSKRWETVPCKHKNQLSVIHMIKFNKEDIKADEAVP